jgi:hypothetical protein
MAVKNEKKDDIIKGQIWYWGICSLFIQSEIIKKQSEGGERFNYKNVHTDCRYFRLCRFVFPVTAKQNGK